MADKYIPAIVKAFKDFAIFCRTRWQAAIFGTIFIAILGGLFLSLYFGYKKISSLEIEVNKSVEILEGSHDTLEDLQEGLAQSIEDNIKIENVMAKCVYKYDADSMLVIKFHDSRTDLRGKHDFFYSVTNEILTKGGMSYILEMQNIPIVRLGKVITPFLDNKSQVVEVRNLGDNPWLQARLGAHEVDTLFCRPIFDESNHLLGFTVLVYEIGTKVPVGEKREEIFGCFENTTKEISLILSN